MIGEVHMYDWGGEGRYTCMIGEIHMYDWGGTHV